MAEIHNSLLKLLKIMSFSCYSQASKPPDKVEKYCNFHCSTALLHESPSLKDDQYWYHFVGNSMRNNFGSSTLPLKKRFFPRKSRK